MKKTSFNKVTIVGVGLIGGSLGLAIRQKSLAKSVCGYFRSGDRAQKAVRIGAVDAVELNLFKAVKDADLVILAAPVSENNEILKKLTRTAVLSPNSVVVDVGSTKLSIQKVAAKLIRQGRFVGCHPMAGSEKRGLDHSSSRLFEGAVCFMTGKNESIEKLWEAVGSRVIHLNAQEHDAWVSRASHLPHVLAFSLLTSITEGSKNVVRASAGWPNPSLRSFARLAKSEPSLWTDILMSNRAEILKAISQYEKSLSSFKMELSRKNVKKMNRLIETANRNAKHFLPDV